MATIVKNIQARINLTQVDTVIDIGNNLLKFYSIKNLHKINIDPNGSKEDDIELVSSIKDVQDNIKAKVVTTTIDNLKDVRNILHPDGICVIESDLKLKQIMKQTELNVFDVNVVGTKLRIFLCHPGSREIHYYIIDEILENESKDKTQVYNK